MDSNTGSIETHSGLEPVGETPVTRQAGELPTQPIQIQEAGSPDRTSPAAVLRNETVPQTEQQESRSGITLQRRHLVAIGAGTLAVVAGSVLAGSLIFGNHGDSVKAATAPEKDKATTGASPATVAEATPAETPSPIETGAQSSGTATPELSASDSPEQLGLDVITQALTNWRNAGTHDTPPSGVAAGDYAASTAQKTATTYENALFIDGWSSHQDLLAYSQQLQAQNNQNIYLSLETANEANPFKWGIDSEKVIDQGSGSNEVDLTIKFREFENATQSNAMNIDPDLIHTVSTYQRIDVKLLKFGDTMKISAISKITDPQP